MRITTTSERMIRVIWIEVADWMANVLEGSRESASEFRRDALADWLARHSAPAYNAAPPHGALPRYQCRAMLQSTALDPQHLYSELVVAWFVETVDAPLPQLALTMVNQIPWETTAGDVTIDDL